MPCRKIETTNSDVNLFIYKNVTWYLATLNDWAINCNSFWIFPFLQNTPYGNSLSLIDVWFSACYRIPFPCIDLIALLLLTFHASTCFQYAANDSLRLNWTLFVEYDCWKKWLKRCLGQWSIISLANNYSSWHSCAKINAWLKHICRHFFALSVFQYCTTVMRLIEIFLCFVVVKYFRNASPTVTGEVM